MADIKDKVITAESLKTLHEYNESTYETKENVESIETSLDGKINEVKNRITPIANGGTNSSNGATGLANLFASGNTVLSSYQYGDELPTAGTVGRIFFKRLIEE